MPNAKTKLFDDRPRSYYGLSGRAETIYSYLNRTALPEYSKIRGMLERWVDHLPAGKRDDLVGRIRHKGNGSAEENRRFNAAFFELFLHEFLTSPASYVTVEPDFSGKTPDFEVTEHLADGSNLSYVVEATDIDLKRGTKLERQWNELSAIDSLNELPIRQFSLFLRTSGILDSTPRNEDLKRPFIELAKGTNFEELLTAFRRDDFNYDDAPSATYRLGSWKATGTLIPVLPEYHQERDRFVAWWSIGADPIDDIGKTKERLLAKAKRYRRVNNLIIALRCDRLNNRLDEVLFGRQTVALTYLEGPRGITPISDSYSQAETGRLLV